MGATDVGNPQSLNLYAYVQNDPINFVDPTGLNASSSGGGSCWVSWSATAWYQGNEFLGITNFSYSVSCTGGSGGNSGGGNSGGGGNVPLPQDDKPDDELIHCDPAVKKQIEKLNQRIRSQPSSLVSREFGFEVERVNGKLEVKPIRMSLAGNEFVPNWNENVVWVIHSHPSIRGNAEQPSTADRNYAIGNKLIVVTTLVEPDTERSTLFNGNKPKDDKGKDRAIPLPNCPKKSKQKK
jgi:proteasome lid subunit RPN8/RPN11